VSRFENTFGLADYSGENALICLIINELGFEIFGQSKFSVIPTKIAKFHALGLIEAR
jgi:hypothetical protein